LCYNTIYTSYSHSSGWTVGYSAGLNSGNSPVSTNFLSAGFSWNLSNDLVSCNVSAWTYNKYSEWNFNPSFSVNPVYYSNRSGFSYLGQGLVESIDKQRNMILLANYIDPQGGGDGRNGKKYFEGIRVYEIFENVYSGAFTLPGVGIFVGKGTYDQRNVSYSVGQMTLRHEFGHILQRVFYGDIASRIVCGSSILSAWFSKSNIEHQRSWSEIQANTLSYYYFKSPSDWDMDVYPINVNYISPSILNRLNYWSK
jgi:hypothetical protein